MKKINLVIPLVILLMIQFLYADIGMVFSQDVLKQKVSQEHTSTFMPDSLSNSVSSENGTDGSQGIIWGSMAPQTSPTRMIRERSIFPSKSIRQKNWNRLTELIKVHQTTVNEYMNAYRTGGFGFPLIIDGYSKINDPDVIESWDYQKNLMYPYGHTPTDFYHP